MIRVVRLADSALVGYEGVQLRDTKLNLGPDPDFFPNFPISVFSGSFDFGTQFGFF